MPVAVKAEAETLAVHDEGFRPRRSVTVTVPMIPPKVEPGAPLPSETGPAGAEIVNAPDETVNVMMVSAAFTAGAANIDKAMTLPASGAACPTRIDFSS
jgi:hypothetical protein